ncbi:hypothetical protein AAG906_033730 [Vitis piasezkii]
MKMKDSESVKDYSSRLMDVVNQMRLLGKVFTNQKFEAKISAIEESCDLQSLTIVELTSKLHSQEQRVLMRGDEATKGAFQANHKGKSYGNLQGKKFFKNNKGKVEGSSRKKTFHLALIAAEPTMLRKIVGTKVNLLLIVISAINLATVRSIAEQKKQSQQQTQQYANVKLGNGEVVQAKGKWTIAINTKKGHVFSAKIDESVVWHKRYGHFNLKSLKFMQEAGMVEDMPEITINAQTCESCELRKQHRKSFPQNMSKRATHKLELVHSNIYGLMSTASLSNNVYFALFIDDFSRMTWVYFLKTKSQVLSVFKSFKKMVETQSGQKVKVLESIMEVNIP